MLPPFTALRSVQTLVQGDKLKLQLRRAGRLAARQTAPTPASVSGRMLAKLGCRYVLAGHSERRQYHHEDDALVNAKARAVGRDGLTPDPVRRRAARRSGRQAATSGTAWPSWTAGWPA